VTHGWIIHGEGKFFNEFCAINSHLEARVKPLKGFESFKYAELWLNAYFLRRRTKKWADCSKKFRRLNGKTSLEITKKPGVDLPIFF
jgi:hypothetical protein